MNKSTLLSIREFANFTGTNQSTLRYYDEIGLLPPAERGDNNYRYYTPFQLIKLNYINVLIDLGVPLSIIRDMDCDRTPESVIDLLDRQEMKLDHRLYELRQAYSIIHTYRENIQGGLSVQDGLIRTETMNEARYVLGQQNDFRNQETFYGEFIRFCRASDENRINLRYPVGGYYENIKSYLHTPSQPDRFFSLDPMGNKTLPEGLYLVGYCRGYYGDFGDLPEKMESYARENNLTFKGPVHVIYLLDEISISKPDQYLSRTSVAVVGTKNKTSAR